METPEAIDAAYRFAEESKRKYKSIGADPQYLEAKKLLSILIKKYGKKIVYLNMKDLFY